MNELRAHYEEHGYVVVPALGVTDLIDQILDAYASQIVPARTKFYRQSSSRYGRNKLSADGYVTESFLDIHAYDSFPTFQSLVLKTFFHEKMRAVLSAITGSASHNLMQSMLFDANTETWPHQDWWYLDSVPRGNLLAVWLAMEDIHEAAGRFYVLPKSQDVILHESSGEPLRHSDWVARVGKYVDEHRASVTAPALKKGDALFWNSRTIHGSLPTQDARYSRKSLTAHFLPSNMGFGNLFIKKDWIKFREYQGHKHFANQPEYSLKAALISKLKMALYDNPALLKVARQFQRRAISDV